MRMPRKDKDGMHLADEIDIRNIAPASGQEADILLARDRLSDAEPHDPLSGNLRAAYSSVPGGSMRRCESGFRAWPES
jgi:hypothetical protein